METYRLVKIRKLSSKTFMSDPTEESNNHVLLTIRYCGGDNVYVNGVYVIIDYE